MNTKASTLNPNKLLAEIANFLKWQAKMESSHESIHTHLLRQENWEPAINHHNHFWEFIGKLAS